MKESREIAEKFYQNKQWDETNDQDVIIVEANKPALILAIASALDQREQSVWEEALEAVPEVDQINTSDMTAGECRGFEFARQSLLSARSKSLKE